MNRSSICRLAMGMVACLWIPAGAPVPQDPDAKRVATDRHEAALLVWTQLAKTYGETTAECDTRALWSRRLAEAAAESGAVPAREAFAQHLTRMEQMMVVVKSLQHDGRRSDADVAVVAFHVAEAKALARR